MKRKSLLIVDDEQIILDSLARELTSARLEVSTAASGEEAIARINTGLFDLVTTDLLMPGLDGFEVLKAAKRGACRPSSLSSQAMGPWNRQLMRCGWGPMIFCRNHAIRMNCFIGYPTVS